MTKRRLPATSLHPSEGVSPSQQNRFRPIQPVGETWCPDQGDHTVAASQFGDLAYQALLVEAELTPKPGLVDAANDGAHTDMTLATFHKSADALKPFFKAFVLAGCEAAKDPDALALAPLRALGLSAERAMLEATGHVNTHKGAIFAFGLLLGAAGRLMALDQPITTANLCNQTARFVRGLVDRELADNPKTASSAGEYIFHRYGLKGARGEAESGFASVRHWSLPAYRQAREAGFNEDSALLSALVALMANHDDTNLVARGGLDGLAFTRNKSRHLIPLSLCGPDAFKAQLAAFDEALIARNLSPGGSADLLAVTWFLVAFDRLTSDLGGART